MYVNLHTWLSTSFFGWKKSTFLYRYCNHLMGHVICQTKQTGTCNLYLQRCSGGREGVNQRNVWELGRCVYRICQIIKICTKDGKTLTMHRKNHKNRKSQNTATAAIAVLGRSGCHCRAWSQLGGWWPTLLVAPTCACHDVGGILFRYLARPSGGDSDLRNQVSITVTIHVATGYPRHISHVTSTGWNNHEPQQRPW